MRRTDLVGGVTTPIHKYGTGSITQSGRKLHCVTCHCVKMSSQSITIHGGKETSEVTLHYLPCKVETDCEGDTPKDPSSERRGRRPAEVDSYFEPVIREGSGTIRMGMESSQVLTATFRGRPLKGMDISVPEGYRGVVLREQGTVSHDSQVLN